MPGRAGMALAPQGSRGRYAVPTPPGPSSALRRGSITPATLCAALRGRIPLVGPLGRVGLPRQARPKPKTIRAAQVISLGRSLLRRVVVQWRRVSADHVCQVAGYQAMRQAQTISGRLIVGLHLV